MLNHPAHVVDEIRVRPRVDQRQQRAAPSEVALERRVFDVEQRARGAGHDDDVGVFGNLALGRQQKLLHPIVLVAQRLGRALEALLRGARLALDGPLAVTLEEVGLLLAGARQLQHRVGDVLLGDLRYLHRLFAEGHPHEALAEFLRRDAVLAEQLWPLVRIGVLHAEAVALVGVAVEQLANEGSRGDLSLAERATTSTSRSSPSSTLRLWLVSECTRCSLQSKRLW